MKKHLSLILFEFDRFKNFDDQFDHSVGDVVLKDAAT